jgi:hypothetical protein
MAFNIIAETSKTLDYNKIHKEIFEENLNFEFVPMPKLGLNGGDAIGICMPLNNANNATWIQLKSVLKKLKSKFSCKVYDLYGGQKLGFFNINSFKQNLFLK